MSLSMQIFIQFLKRTLAKALTQHLVCVKISVISFSVESLIIVDASLLDQGFTSVKEVPTCFFVKFLDICMKNLFFLHIILEALMHQDSMSNIHPFNL